MPDPLTPPPLTPNRSWRRPLKVLGALCAVAIVCGLPLSCWRALDPTVGRDVKLADAPIDGLPGSASHVSYYLKGLFGPQSCYEFDVPEPDFLVWAAKNQWPVAPVAANGVGKDRWPKPSGPSRQIYRYGHSTTRMPGDPEEIEIEYGYYYEWVDPTASDDRLLVGYDRSQGRAFYERDFR